MHEGRGTTGRGTSSRGTTNAEPARNGHSAAKSDIGSGSRRRLRRCRWELREIAQITAWLSVTGTATSSERCGIKVNLMHNVYGNEAASGAAYKGCADNQLNGGGPPSAPVLRRS